VAEYPRQPPEGYRIELFAEQDAVGERDVIDVWRRETGMPDDEAARRIHEVLMVATRDGRLAGVSSAYLQRNPQLQMPLWHFRVLVGEAHRTSKLATNLALAGHDHFRERFVEGKDMRAPGMIFVVESEVLKRRAHAVWPYTGFTFVGENERGEHVRVRYFPGALAPDPPR
jgi:hypothetical protein